MTFDYCSPAELFIANGRVQAPHEDGNRKPNEKNDEERSEGIGENGVHMRLPGFDCYEIGVAFQ